MHDQIQIRLADARAASAVSRVLYESFIEFKPLYTAEGFAATTPAEQQVLIRMQEGPVWVAFRPGVPAGSEAVGTVAAVAKGESVYMRGMAVLPSARTSGVASRLVETVERWASSRGARRVFLTTTPFLLGAIRLYERHGFHRAETPTQDLYGTPLFTMEKTISGGG